MVALFNQFKAFWRSNNVTSTKDTDIVYDVGKTGHLTIWLQPVRTSVYVCGNQRILLTLTGTLTNSKNIKIFIWPVILVQGFFIVINRYQKEFAEQIDYWVRWLHLIYRQAYKMVVWF